VGRGEGRKGKGKGAGKGRGKVESWLLGGMDAPGCMSVENHSRGVRGGTPAAKNRFCA